MAKCKISKPPQPNETYWWASSCKNARNEVAYWKKEGYKARVVVEGKSAKGRCVCGVAIKIRKGK